MDWKDDFTFDVLQRGHELHLEERVDFEIDEDMIWGVVHDTADYNVNIEVDDQGVQSMACDCPDSQKLRCQHMAALMFAFEEESKDFFENMRDLFDESALEIEDVLDTLDKDSLIECLSFIYQRSEEAKVLANLFVHNYFEEFFDAFDEDEYDDELEMDEIDLTDCEISEICLTLDMYFDVMVMEDYDEDDPENEGIYLFLTSLEAVYINSGDDEKRAIFTWMTENYDAFETIDEADLYFSCFENLFVDDFLNQTKFTYLYDLVLRDILPFEENNGSESAMSALFAVAKVLDRENVIEEIYAKNKHHRYVFAQYIQHLLKTNKNNEALQALEEDCSFLRRLSRRDYETCGVITGLAYEIGDLDAFRYYFEHLIHHDDWVDSQLFIEYKNSFNAAQWPQAFREISDVMKMQQDYADILIDLQEYNALLEHIIDQGDVSLLLLHEDILSAAHPQRVIDCYLRIADAYATQTGRPAYQKATEILGESLKHPNAKTHVVGLLETWKTKYSNRKAMLEIIETFEQNL